MNEQQMLLRARATLLMRVPAKIAAFNEMLQLIGFTIGEETYGVESIYVKEVCLLKDYTFIPGLPAFVLGIINVRGRILSVVNLKKFLGLAEKGLGELNKVVVLGNDHMEFGILADAILGAHSILRAGLQVTIPTVIGIGAAFMKGVSPEHMIVLDGERILVAPAIVIHQETEQEKIRR